jgi:PAS domain S-box-containing protein
MKTADRMKCETLVKMDGEIKDAGGSAFVDNRKKGGRSLADDNIDEEQALLKAIKGNLLQLDKRERSTTGQVSFKILVDNVNIGICILGEDMRHVYANKKYCEITGYSAPDLEKIEFTRLVLTDKQETFKNTHQIFFCDEINIKKGFVATAIRKDGKRCSIECSGCMISWHGKPAIQCIFRDITKDLERENKIRASNKNLSHKIENVTAELAASSENLKQKQSELISHKLELEKVNKELLQTNRAMSILARNIDNKKKEVEQKTAHTILTKIIPIINDLKKEKGIQKYLAEIEALGAYVKGLAPESDLYSKIVISLSATEMRIAALIKNGMSSQRIADILNISLETVKTHRKKIRKKLDIINSSANLTSYLRSVMDGS